MAGLATQETNKSVSDFIDSIESASKREDSKTLIKMIQEITGHEPKIWGDHFIIGFGKYTYTRKGGKEEFEWFNVGFAPRKTKMTVYLTFDINEQEELTSKLGKCKWGKGCLYINKLADIDLDVLAQLIEKSKDARWH
ncbi:MAG: DUF1801 domain-containing protein [Balneola sp.]|nr:MAG: DUF1801 domain-containing protein [Balneola sp.]